MSNLIQKLYIDIPSKRFAVQPETLHISDYIDLPVHEVTPAEISAETYLSLVYKGNTVALAKVTFVENEALFPLNLETQGMYDAFTGKADDFIDNFNILIDDQENENIILNTLIPVSNAPTSGNLPDLGSSLDFTRFNTKAALADEDTMGANDSENLWNPFAITCLNIWEYIKIKLSLFKFSRYNTLTFSKSNVDSETKLLTFNHGLGEQFALHVTTANKTTKKALDFDDIIYDDANNLSVVCTEAYEDMSTTPNDYVIRVSL